MPSFPARLGSFVAASGLALLATPLVPAAAATTFTWTQLSPTNSPSGRYGHNMVYDSARRVTVMFGGANPSGYQSDTWEWNGQSWSLRTPTLSPEARREYAMAYDTARHATVVFGGMPGRSGLLGDTWTWDGTNWTQQSPATSPSPRWDSAMVYDAAIGKVVLFGGFDQVAGNFQLENDTWAWDGTTWTQLQPLASPPARQNHAMAYDSTRGRVVLFGGELQLNGAGLVQDTWEFDGTTWTQAAPAVSPAARIAHTMTYDAVRNVTLLFGGGAGMDFGDTWAWDGTGWTQLTPTPAPACRDHTAMAFGQGGNTVLFGGYVNCTASALGYVADTWQGGNPPTSPIVVSGSNVNPIAEGYAYSPLTTATFSGGVAPYTAAINWGDGTTSSGNISPNPNGGYYVAASKAFLEEGLYTTQITVTDATGASATANGSMNVTDAYLAPSGINFTTRKRVTFSGPVATFTDADPNGVIGDYTATINWGDGTTPTACPGAACSISVQPSGAFQVQASHQYGRQGTYSVTIQVRDSGGFSATATSTATVLAGD